MTTARPALSVGSASVTLGRIGRPRQGQWSRAWQRFRENRLALGMGIIVLTEIAIAIAAPLLSEHVTRYDPDAQDLARTLAGPSAAHWLGTDQLGRDTLTRLIYGARVSLGVAALTVAMSATLGTLVGLTAGFYGGNIDMLLMRLVDVVLAMPAIFFFIMLAVLFQPNAVGLAVVIASVSWVSVARLVRAEVLATKHLDFIVAARSVGVRNGRLMVRHVLPAAFPVILVAASLSIAQVILAEAALSFLGLGIRPPTPSWGNMITAAQVYYTRAVYLAMFPGLAIFITVLAVNMIGNAVRDALDPSLN